MLSVPPRKGVSRRGPAHRRSRVLNPFRPTAELLESRTLMSADRIARSHGLPTAADILPFAVAAESKQTLRPATQSFATTVQLARGVDPFGQGVVTGPRVVLDGRTAPFALVRLDVGIDA